MATPKSPRSPIESTESVTKGAASKTPFLITLNAPDCEQTNIRSSGAIAIAVGEAIPLATVVSTKPDGSVAAEAKKDQACNRKAIGRNNRARCSPAKLPNEANAGWADLGCMCAYQFTARHLKPSMW